MNAKALLRTVALLTTITVCTFTFAEGAGVRDLAEPSDTLVQANFAVPDISQEDLAMTDNPAAPGSSAMILERQVYTDDAKGVETHFARIKVLKEDGTKYGDVMIPYDAKRESVEDIRGRTVRRDGTSIEFSGTVYDNVVAKMRRLNYQAKAFTLPGVEAGSILEYSYTLRSRFRYPDYISHPGMYKFEGGWSYPSVKWILQDDVYTRHGTFRLRPIAGGDLHWRIIRVRDNPRVEPDGTVSLEIRDIPPLAKEEHLPPQSMLNSRIHFYYVVGTGTQWFNYGKVREQQYDKFVTPSTYIKRMANEIAPSDLAEIVRLHKLYDRVQQIHHVPEQSKSLNQSNAIRENKSAEDVLRGGYAFGKEANFLFTALARAAGFETYIVQISDRSKNIFDHNIPDYNQFDEVIVLVRLKQMDVFLDPAASFCPFALLPWYEADTRGIAWAKDGGFDVNVPPQNASKALTERIADLKLESDGTLDGEVEILFYGEEARERRAEAVNQDVAEREQGIKDQIKKLLPAGTEVQSTKVSGWEGVDDPLRIKCRMKIPFYGRLTGQRILFSPAIFQSQSKASLTTHLRTQPVYFDHAYEEKDRVVIALPQNYRLEALPENANTGATFARCEVKRSSDNGKVVMERHEEFNGYYFDISKFSTLWTYQATVRQRDAEKAVLHHVAPK